MKVVRYTLLPNGKVPSSMSDGGYFPVPNGGQSPRDYDLIGLTNGWNGLGEYTTKAAFETYVKSKFSDVFDPVTNRDYAIQDTINEFWNRPTRSA